MMSWYVGGPASPPDPDPLLLLLLLLPELLALDEDDAVDETADDESPLVAEAVVLDAVVLEVDPPPAPLDAPAPDPRRGS